MPVRLVFLGRLADVAGAPMLEVEGASSLGAIQARLEAQLTEALSGPRIRIAVNGTLVADPTSLSIGDGDEIAFLPPVSGG